MPLLGVSLLIGIHIYILFSANVISSRASRSGAQKLGEVDIDLPQEQKARVRIPPGYKTKQSPDGRKLAQSGTGVMILKIFLPKKIGEKNCVFDAKHF
jgi:hypothetical protein